MKIANEFRAFLEMHQHLYLPHIGRFHFEFNESNKTVSGGLIRPVTFVADNKQSSDPELITFSSDHLKVETCIAESDLNSFCSCVIELLIQGFEAEIPGVGFLHYESGNQLKFSEKSIYHNAIKLKRNRVPAAFSVSFWV